MSVYLLGTNSFLMELIVKCNIDASIFQGHQKHETMACLQDSNGHFISSLSSCFTGILSPLEAEARAHNVALHWLSSRDQRHVIIETDCKQILDIMKARNFQNNEVGDILSCVHKISNLHNYRI